MFQSNEDLQKIINRRQRTKIDICVIYLFIISFILMMVEKQSRCTN